MKSSVISILSCIVILCGCAAQQDVITLDDRMGEIEQRNKERNVDLEIKEEAIRNQAAMQHTMIDKLRDEIQILTGRLEETEYLLKQKMMDLEDLDANREKELAKIKENTSINKDRIIRLEEYLNFEPSVKSESEKIPDEEAEKSLSGNDIYKSSKEAFDQGDFEAAREGFKKLIQRYPESEQADNAQFWIGETYYREKWYEKAILEYQQVIEKYPKGNKVQASLLKQGLSFYNLGDKANARLILKELVKQYPKSIEAEIARRQLEGFPP